MKYLHISFVFGILVFLLSACSEEPDEVLTPVEKLNVVETMLQAGDEYSDFVKALTKGGLTNRLENSGNHTVFAPTKAAMDKYIQQKGTSIDDIDGVTLKNDFSYHIISGVLESEDFDGIGYLETLSTEGPEGNALSFYYDNTATNMLINDVANVSFNAITGLSNGVIHSIDTVLTPPTIMDLIDFNPEFNKIGEALILTNQENKLKTGLKNTFFAPCNDAFPSFLEEFKINGLEDLPTDALINTVFFHLINDTILYSNQIEESNILTSIDKNLAFINDTTTNQIFLRDFAGRNANFKQRDIYARNGVLHSINNVMSPGN